MNTIKELKHKGQELKRRIAKFGAPLGNDNAAGDHAPFTRGGIGNKNTAGLHNMGEKLRHEEKQKYHIREAVIRGENQGRPPPGSHAEASSHHGSAAFYHGKAAEAYAAGKIDEANEYNKKAYRASSIADSKSKNILTGKTPYPTAKENNTAIGDGLTSRERSAKRSDTFLKQRFIGLR